MPKHAISIPKPSRQIQPNLTAYSWSGLRATLYTYFPEQKHRWTQKKSRVSNFSALMKALALLWADSLEWEVGKVSDDKAHTHPIRYIWATLVSHLISAGLTCAEQRPSDCSKVILCNMRAV